MLRNVSYTVVKTQVLCERCEHLISLDPSDLSECAVHLADIHDRDFHWCSSRCFQKEVESYIGAEVNLSFLNHLATRQSARQENMPIEDVPF